MARDWCCMRGPYGDGILLLFRILFLSRRGLVRSIKDEPVEVEAMIAEEERKSRFCFSRTLLAVLDRRFIRAAAFWKFKSSMGGVISTSGGAKGALLPRTDARGQFPSPLSEGGCCCASDAFGSLDLPALVCGRGPVASELRLVTPD